MSEHSSNLEKNQSSIDLFRELSSEDVRNDHYQWMLGTLPHLSDQSIDREEARLLEAKKKAVIDDDREAEARIYTELTTLYGRALLRYSYERELYAMGEHPGLLCANSRSPIAIKVANIVQSGAIPAEQSFVSFEHPSFLKAQEASESINYETISGDKPLQIRTQAFVGAQGFTESWHAGRGKYNKIIGDEPALPSSQVIQRYKALSAITAPPIEGAIGYIQPDGKIVYISDSAHRTAAAVLRGDEYVYVKKLNLYPMKQTLVY